MSKDYLRAYQAAQAQLEDARRQVEAVVSFLRDVADELWDWKRVRVTHVGGGDYPKELASCSGTPTIDGREWKSAQDLHEALVAWHQAREQVRRAWKAIPEGRRVGLSEPGNRPHPPAALVAPGGDFPLGYPAQGRIPSPPDPGPPG